MRGMIDTPEQTAAPKPAPTVADLIEFHSGYGESIEFDDADRNRYSQETCQCGMPLGMHLSLEDHRAREVEAFINARLAESFLEVRLQLQQVADEMALHEVPLHIQATLDQVIVRNSIRLGLPDPEVEIRSRALRKAATDLGLPHGVNFYNEDGSATFIWQQFRHRVTVYITHGAPYEVEDVPDGPVTPFRSEDPEAAAQEVMILLAAGKDD